MSYEIIHGKCFVKLEEDLFIPMLVNGSSNCYESIYTVRGMRDRRERHFSVWAKWGFDKEAKDFATRKQIEENLKKWDKTVREENLRYQESNIISKDADLTNISGLVRYGGGNINMRGWKTFIRNGMNNAKTIPELIEKGLTLYIAVYKYPNQDTIGYPKTTEEFFQMYKEAQDFIKKNPNHSIMVSFNDGCDRVLRAYKQPRKHTRVHRSELKEYFVIKNLKNGYYYSRGTRRGIYWNECESWCKAFRTKKDAEHSIKRILNRTFMTKDDFVIQLIDNSKNFRPFENI